MPAMSQHVAPRHAEPEAHDVQVWRGGTQRAGQPEAPGGPGRRKRRASAAPATACENTVGIGGYGRRTR